MEKSSKFKKYILLSVLLHFAIVFVMNLISYLELKNQKDNQKIEISILTPEELNALDADKASQVVETDSAHANNQLDEQAKYNSEKSNTVEKETKARLGQEFKNAAKQGTKTKLAQKGQTKTTEQKMLANSFDPYATLVKNTTSQEAKEFAKGQTGAEAGDTSTTNDNLTGVTEDLMTKLNTKEYKYYGYYHRIKVQLNQWWQPKVREKVSKMVSQGRRIATSDNKVTKLVIVLNDVGNIVNVQVLAESGVLDLDAAAIEAFRAAAPFPNPPKGIIESDGKVRIRWDFVVES